MPEESLAKVQPTEETVTDDEQQSHFLSMRASTKKSFLAQFNKPRQTGYFTSSSQTQQPPVRQKPERAVKLAAVPGEFKKRINEVGKVMRRFQQQDMRYF